MRGNKHKEKSQKMARLLIVENEADILKGLLEFLALEGFEVCPALGEKEANRLLEKSAFDLALIDISLDDGDGFSVFKAVKEHGIPAVFLTASGDESNTVKGLDMGADDYIAKPFRPMELVSRIKGVIRRHKTDDSAVLIGDLRIETEKGTVFKGSDELTLSALEWRLLMLFVNNRGKLLSRNRLLEDIWDIAGDFVNDNTLTVYIKRLREKIEDDPQNPQLIRTVRGLGYRMD